jgi:hypothetical protein
VKTFLNNLRTQAEENPMLALGIGTAVVAAATRFLGAGVDMKNSRAWAKEVNRRSAKDAGQK